MRCGGGTGIFAYRWWKLCQMDSLSMNHHLPNHHFLTFSENISWYLIIMWSVNFLKHFGGKGHGRRKTEPSKVASYFSKANWSKGWNPLSYRSHGHLVKNLLHCSASHFRIELQQKWRSPMSGLPWQIGFLNWQIQDQHARMHGNWFKINSISW